MRNSDFHSQLTGIPPRLVDGRKGVVFSMQIAELAPREIGPQRDGESNCGLAYLISSRGMRANKAHLSARINQPHGRASLSGPLGHGIPNTVTAQPYLPAHRVAGGSICRDGREAFGKYWIGHVRIDISNTVGCMICPVGNFRPSRLVPPPS